MVHDGAWKLSALVRMSGFRHCTSWPCGRLSPSPWRRSQWLLSPGSRAGSSSPWRSEAGAAACCTGNRARLPPLAARRRASGRGEGPGCFPGGRGCCRALPPARWEVGSPSCAGSRWRPGAGRRCGAAAGGRRRPPHLIQRDHRTKPSSETPALHCPADTMHKVLLHIYGEDLFRSNWL